MDEEVTLFSSLGSGARLEGTAPDELRARTPIVGVRSVGQTQFGISSPAQVDPGLVVVAPEAGDSEDEKMQGASGAPRGLLSRGPRVLLRGVVSRFWAGSLVSRKCAWKQSLPERWTSILAVAVGTMVGLWMAKVVLTQQEQPPLEKAASPPERGAASVEEAALEPIEKASSGKKYCFTRRSSHFQRGISPDGARGLPRCGSSLSRASAGGGFPG